MKKIALSILFITSMLAAGNINNLPDAKIISTKDCQIINLNVNFKTNSAVIEKQSYKEIQEFADYMSSNPSNSALIAGHTDSMGNDAHNKSLSQRRAVSVYNKLIANGVSAKRLTHVGYGEAKPKATNKTEAGRRANRRIEAEIH